MREYDCASTETKKQLANIELATFAVMKLPGFRLITLNEIDFGMLLLMYLNFFASWKNSSRGYEIEKWLDGSAAPMDSTKELVEAAAES